MKTEAFQIFSREEAQKAQKAIFTLQC